MKESKILFILVDGIGDICVKYLNKQTPLQSTNIPNIDKIASTGVTGLMDPVEVGLACGSDTAHMNIFGYNPFKEYKGRGSFEVMGSDIPMDGNEIGFKCNFAYMNQQTQIVEKRRVDREFPKWGLPLIEKINGNIISEYPDYKVTAIHATEHRIGVKVSGPNLTSNITGTDPLKDFKKIKQSIPKDQNNEKDIFTAKLVNQLHISINNILSQHEINLNRVQQGLIPANIVLLRGCGSRLNVPSFQQMWGFKGFMIAPTAIINGLGQSIGLDILKVDGATGDYETDLSAKAHAAVQQFKNNDEYDFCFLHIKAVDDAGHDKSYDIKNKFLKKIDEMVELIISELNKNFNTKEQDFIFCITGDHTTPCKTGDHTFEPVPFAVSSLQQINSSDSQDSTNNPLKNFRDQVSAFDEISCSQGLLGRFPGSQAMKILTNYKKQISILQQSKN